MPKGNIVLYDRLMSLALVIGLALSMFVLATKYLEYDLQQELISETRAGIVKFELISSEVVDTLLKLNKLPDTQCSEQLLTNMRREMFASKYIHDIGFLEGKNLVCTTGLGVLDEPFIEEDPDYIGRGGFRVFVKRRLALFESEVNASIVRFQAYNAVVKLESLDALVSKQYDWELIFVDKKKKRTHVSGMKGIYAISEANESESPFHHVACSQNTPYCLAVMRDGKAFSHTRKASHILVFLVIICFSLIVYVLFRNYLDTYRSLTSRIKRGFKKNAFFCLYQPIVELKTGRIIGCEVLARYKDSQGEVFPDQFIPIINTLDLTWPFTEQVIQRTLKDIQPKQEQLKKFRFNINFFAKDISNAQVLDLLTLDFLKSADIQLIVEITEDEKLATKTSEKTLKRLSNNGFEIAVDDFGTGYSNLKQLRDIHCDTLKIDRSFISEMEDGSIRSTLIPHIVEIARQLNLKIVAEGVENEMQQTALLEEGVEFAQGWLFGKPMPLEQLVALLEKQNLSN